MKGASPAATALSSLRDEAASRLHPDGLQSTGAMAVHYSSATDLWATPQAFFARYDARFGFTLDVCATPSNAKCSVFFTEEDDGLSQVWRGICWMNPPYGRAIGRWMRKAYESSLSGATVVCLVPARTDTAWWHDYAMRGEIEFIRGRLRFSGSQKDAPFPVAIVVFYPRAAQGMSVGTAKTPQAAEGVARQPGPEGMRPDTRFIPNTPEKG